MKFKISRKNYTNLLSLARVLKKTKARSLEIGLGRDMASMPRFSDVMTEIYTVLDYETFFGVWLENFPYCVINGSAADHIARTKNYRGEKTKGCQKCKFKQECPGFPKGYFKKYGNKELQPIPDIPVEVMIEVESRCNFRCTFCFNEVSFAKKARGENLSSAYVKKIIDHACVLGIGTVRFTGGEPLLRKDIFNLMGYAKSKGMYVKLNTNGSLVDGKAAKKMCNIVDNVLIPIESCKDNDEQKITGHSGALTKKLEAVGLLKKEKISMVRVGTVALRENIGNFDNIAKMILKLPFDEWEWNRPISNRKDNVPMDSRYFSRLADEIISLRRKTGRNISIANPYPFCAVKNPESANLGSGAFLDTGHGRMVIDPRGFVKPHYYIEKNIGDPLDLLGAWNHPFMKKIRKLGFLPSQCQECKFKSKCRGGSRFEAKFASGSYNWPDPLASVEKKSEK